MAGYDGTDWMVARQEFVEKLLLAERNDIPGIVAGFFKEHVYKIGMAHSMTSIEKQSIEDSKGNVEGVRDYYCKMVFRNIGEYLQKRGLFQHDRIETDFGENNNYYILVFGTKGAEQGELNI